MIDPPGRRRPKGRFGGLRQFGVFRGVGTRDWAARVSLRGERGCASEPVAREGRAGRGVGGGGGGPEGAGQPCAVCTQSVGRTPTHRAKKLKIYEQEDNKRSPLARHDARER